MLSLRLFQSGLVLTALFALGHLLGFLQAFRAARRDPGLAELTRAMREHKTKVLGFEPSILDFREYFSLNFSLLLWTAAGLGFVALNCAEDPAASVRALAPVYTIAFVLLLASSLRFSVVQGVISSALIALAFGSACFG